MIYNFEFFFRLNNYGELKTEHYTLYGYRNRSVNYNRSFYVRVYPDYLEYEMNSDTYPFYYDI